MADMLVCRFSSTISGQAYIRYRLGGGVAHARGSDRRPNRRPFYACCRDQNETVALFCKVNAKRWCLLAEPSPLLGTKHLPKMIINQANTVVYLLTGPLLGPLLGPLCQVRDLNSQS
jgi:hypothetical protein